MSFANKACILGGIGCIASATIGLSQAKSSLTIREQLALDGYELISEKEEIVKEAWKDRAKLYNQEPRNLLLNGLDYQEVEKNPNKLKEECNKYIKGKTRVNTILDGVYEKLVKLCTLNIKEYIESHLNKEEEEKIIGKEETEPWKENFNKHKEEIIKVIKDATADNAKEKLSKFCEEIYPLQKSNKNKDKEFQANQWCIKRKEKPKPEVTSQDSVAQPEN